MQAFAHGLREIRRQAGDPSYRTLADRTHYSRTVVSDAARGERLPTLAVALAYVEACQGDVDEWRARWHLCSQQAVAASTPAAPAPVEPDGGTAGSGPSWPRRIRLLLLSPAVLAAVGILVLAQAEAAIVWHVASTAKPTKPAKPAKPRADTAVIPATVTDGADPGTSGCGNDATVLDSRPVLLPKPATVAGHAFPAGTILGTVSLRGSAHCGGAWARFDPADGIYGSNPEVAAISLTVTRPADGTWSSWHLPHVDETYGDLLLTGMGCVVASVSVELVAPHITASAQTSCRPHS